VDASEEVSSGLFVAGCNASELFESIEETLDEIAFEVEAAADHPLADAQLGAREHGVSDFVPRKTHARCTRTEPPIEKPVAEVTNKGLHLRCWPGPLLDAGANLRIFGPRHEGTALTSPLTCDQPPFDRWT
jgi:hypothetical protein